MKETTAVLNSVIGAILARRETDRGFAVTIERASRTETESYAYQPLRRALNVLEDGSQRTGFLRGVGITVNCQHISGMSLGRTLAHLSYATSGSWPNTTMDGVGARVATLPLLDVEQAAVILGGLLGRARDHRIGVDIFDAVHTLTRWQTGERARDLAARNQIIFDYYTRRALPASERRTA